MALISNLDRHASLFGRMADANGVSLSDAVGTGSMSPQAYRAAVLRCSGCGAEAACEGWHKLHPEGADAAPAYCRNRELLSGLTGK